MYSIHTTSIEQTFFVVSTFSIQHCISSLKLESTKLYIFALFSPPIQILKHTTSEKVKIQKFESYKVDVFFFVFSKLYIIGYKFNNK